MSFDFSFIVIHFFLRDNLKSYVTEVSRTARNHQSHRTAMIERRSSLSNASNEFWR